MMEIAPLLERCRKGDELAWEALVRRFQSRIYGLAYHYAGNAEDARDLAQEVFVRLYESLGLCTDAKTFIPWMIRIGRNICIDHLRRKKARPPAEDIPVEESYNLSDQGQTPEEIYAADSRKQLIYRALQSLTALNREIILLKEIQGLSLEEIASLLGVPLGTIKSRSHRARVELAQAVLALKRPCENGCAP
jgi:RNA polymerase sigma-70 factor (ECF subfamily)